MMVHYRMNYQFNFLSNQNVTVSVFQITLLFSQVTTCLALPKGADVWVAVTLINSSLNTVIRLDRAKTVFTKKVMIYPNIIS